MIANVLNRTFVLDQIAKIRGNLKSLVDDEMSRSRLLRPEIQLSEDEIRTTNEQLGEAIRREQTWPSGQGNDYLFARGSLGESLSPLDDIAFFSRDPIINIVQSCLEEYITTHPKEHRLAIPGLKPTDVCPVTNISLEQNDESFRFLGEFEPADPGWLSIAVVRAMNLFRKKHPFNLQPPSPYQVPDNFRVLMVGDWGTGLPRAQKIADQMRRIIELRKNDGGVQHVIHLGDVYYSGFEFEYKTRFLPYWPVHPGEPICSWSLNGNHDMYSGGHGYFGTLLEDERFKCQAKSSYFSLKNNFWQIVGLDTAWADARLTDRRGVLADPQTDWLRSVLTYNAGKKVMLLSHHQPFSVYDSNDDILESTAELGDVLATGNVTAWFWGHEHRCMTFEPYNYVSFGRCLGNGGVPVYSTRSAQDPCPLPGQYEFRDRLAGSLEPWGLFAFAELEFRGPECKVRYINENGITFREEFLTSDDARAAASPRSSLDLEPEQREATVVRYPQIEVYGENPISREARVAVDLALFPNSYPHLEATFALLDPPRRWDELVIDVRVSSNRIRFEPASSAGTITVRKEQSSVPVVFQGKLNSEDSEPIVVQAVFSFEGRFCGQARLDVEAESVFGGGNIIKELLSPTDFSREELVQQQSRFEPRPAFRSLGAAAASPIPPNAQAAGSFNLDLNAKSPAMTVVILRQGGGNSGRLTWIIDISRSCRSIRNLPSSLTEDVDLGVNPEQFIQNMYDSFGVIRRGGHVRRIETFGELLYDRAPQCFKSAYRALRAVLGSKFPIQFISADPYVPWELMRPVGMPDSEAKLLLETHPVARWMTDYAGKMPSRLSSGIIKTIAPDYNKRTLGMRVRPLPGAASESAMLVTDFSAERVAGNVEDVLALLQTYEGPPVGYLHFAGHGEFDAKSAAISRILLEDADLNVFDVRNQDVTLGQKFGTLVVFNACQVGASGAVLGAIGGWAEAFLRGGFGGFIGPLWPVNDDDAHQVSREFFKDVTIGGFSAAEALQRVRQRFGRTSPTYLSYLYYGDVMATA